MKLRLTITTALLASSLAGFTKEETKPLSDYATQPIAAQKTVEVCFVLDTTGSMSGLIEGAKQKIWSIANDIVDAKPQPKVRFGLVGYRDRGDAYVTQVTSLTDDIDAIYGALQKFSADGGGDTPESVSEALHESVASMHWSKDPAVFRVVYLVGDAPPQKYDDGKRWQDVCKVATSQGILINTIQCGGIAGTAESWKAIAASAGGAYAAIPQSGNMQQIAAPQDKELQELNVKIGATLIPCGDADLRADVLSKQAAAESAPAASSAYRLSFNSKTKKSVQGEGELIDAIKGGSVKLDEVKRDELPEALRGMSKDELKAHVAKVQAEREVIQKRVAELVKERDAFLITERKKLAAAGKGDSFDEEVAKTLRKQAATKGVEFK